MTVAHNVAWVPSPYIEESGIFLLASVSKGGGKVRPKLNRLFKAVAIVFISCQNNFYAFRKTLSVVIADAGELLADIRPAFGCRQLRFCQDQLGEVVLQGLPAPVAQVRLVGIDSLERQKLVVVLGFFGNWLFVCFYIFVNGSFIRKPYDLQIPNVHLRPAVAAGTVKEDKQLIPMAEP